ncbi:MAG: AzlC family ABC transporter permease [Eubacteriaceae bacterium]|nr:AzlC family ABC transporter permease [Eubacteriaceae bacterium]
MNNSLFNRSIRKKVFLEGLRDGIPIGLGYLAVAFSLGIAAKNAGMSPFQGFLASLLVNASAGEYAGFSVIARDAAYVEMAIMILIANARYLLMSTALSQKFHPDTPFYHRLLVGYDVTDELFGIAIAREGYLDPFYSYGAFSVALPGWSVGTALGIIAGNILPPSVVSALSVALFGMFLAIIIPPAKENRVIGIFVMISFVTSYLAGIIPFVRELSEGTRTIILTVAISSLAAYLFPVKEETNEA